jgi:D-aspartate ligase
VKPVLLVGLGGDIGVYAFLRAAHERYGWRPMVLSQNVTTFGRYSKLGDWLIEPNIHTPSVLVERLNAIAAAHPEHDLMLFTNLDWHVRALAQHRAELDPRWAVPLCDLATFDLVSSKVAFAKACAAVEVRTPITIPVVFQPDAAGTHASQVTEEIARLGLEFPIIGKPALSADWFAASFPGKAKIHHFESLDELTEVIGQLERLGYPSEFLLQEFVPGDETHMRSLTAYRDSSGTITLLAGGQVLLEEHTPGTMGIPAAILTGVDTGAFNDASRILDHTGYFGFANFDYKVSSRTGERVFFEVNPRIGRNNYYVTAAGVNVAQIAVQDLLPHHESEPTGPATASGEILYSVAPYRLLQRYLLDPALKATVDAAKKRAGVFHPLEYKGDGSLRRRLYVKALGWRLARKYKEYYPAPTETGF